MIKKNLTKKTIVITKQTWWNLCHWAAAAGWSEKDIGRVIDKMARDKALSESTLRHFERESRRSEE